MEARSSYPGGEGVILRNQTWKSGSVMNLTFSLDLVGQVGSEDFEDLKVTALAKFIFEKLKRNKNIVMNEFSDFFQG